MSPPPPVSPARSFRADLLLLTAIALGMRFMLLWTTANDPVFQVPMLDAEYLVHWAQDMAGGDWLGSPERTAYFRTPLYPWFLAALFLLPGEDLLAARIAQAILGAATTWIVAEIAFRRFGRIAGWAAGLLAALAWPLLHYGRELLISSLVVFLVALLVFVWDRATPRSGWGRWLSLGILVALCALAWASLAILLPVVAACAALEDASSVRTRARRALLVCAGFACLTLPIALRNRAASGEWVLLASQGGINLWIGNNPEADGMSARLPGFSSWRNDDVDAALAREFGRRVGPSEQDRYFRAKTLAFFRDDPAAAAKLFLKKIYFFFQGYEIRNDRDLDSLRRRDPILGLPLPDFGWIAPLGLAGAWFVRRRTREIVPLLATFGAIALGVSLFFVCARYRMAAWPAILPLAGAGVAGLLDPSSSIRRRVARALLVAVLFALAHIDFLKIRNPDPSQPHFQYGNVYARVGRFDDAEREFRTALSLAPEFGEARHHLGALLLENGRVGEAIPELEASVQLLPQSFRARRSLAEALEASGRVEEAMSLRREILNLSAGDPDDIHALARALGSTGRYREAWPWFERALTEQKAWGRPEDPWLLLNAGQTALAIGEQEKGLALLTRAEAHDEVRGEAIEARALYLIATRQLDRALTLLSNALLESPNEARLIRLRAAARYTKGDATGALEDLQHLLQVDPNDADAKRRIDEIRDLVGDVAPETP